jgi:hypothetical protein
VEPNAFTRTLRECRSEWQASIRRDALLQYRIAMSRVTPPRRQSGCQRSTRPARGRNSLNTDRAYSTAAVTRSHPRSVGVRPTQFPG